MPYALSLLTKASKVCGGYSPLADELGVALPNVSAVKCGKRPMPEEWVSGLASIVGIDLKEALHEFRLEKYGPADPKVRVLEKKVAFGAVAMLLTFVIQGLALPSKSYANTTNKVANLYIVEYVTGCGKWLISWLTTSLWSRSHRPLHR